MRKYKLRASLLLLAVLVLVTGCSDQSVPSGPEIALFSIVCPSCVDLNGDQVQDIQQALDRIQGDLGPCVRIKQALEMALDEQMYFDISTPPPGDFGWYESVTGEIGLWAASFWGSKRSLPDYLSRRCSTYGRKRLTMKTAFAIMAPARKIMLNSAYRWLAGSLPRQGSGYR